MPLYEYECDACREKFEKIRKFSDPPLEVCPKCGAGPVRKLFSSPAIQFKGTGWYITDYARKSSPDTGHSGGKSSSEKSEKSEKTAKGDSGSSSKDSGSSSKSESASSSSDSAPASPASTKSE